MLRSIGDVARSEGEDLADPETALACLQVFRFGGFVAKYMGDGVHIYFGYPQAHEDDAERAVRAGLELIKAVTGCPVLAARLSLRW